MRDANEFPHGRAQWFAWATMLAFGVLLIILIFQLSPSAS
jgi:hypothetical protein